MEAERGKQRFALTSAISHLSLAQNNPYSKVAYFEVLYSYLLWMKLTMTEQIRNLFFIVVIIPVVDQSFDRVR